MLLCCMVQVVLLHVNGTEARASMLGNTTNAISGVGNFTSLQVYAQPGESAHAVQCQHRVHA
jgi:hypothetical protein